MKFNFFLNFISNYGFYLMFYDMFLIELNPETRLRIVSASIKYEYDYFLNRYISHPTTRRRVTFSKVIPKARNQNEIVRQLESMTIRISSKTELWDTNAKFSTILHNNRNNYFKSTSLP